MQTNRNLTTLLGVLVVVAMIAGWEEVEKGEPVEEWVVAHERKPATE